MMMRKPTMAVTGSLLLTITLVVAGSVSAQEHRDHQPGAIQHGTNLPGHDYRNFEIAEPNPEICRQACLDDPRCRAFTFVHPSGRGRPAHCWLKDAVPAPQPDECCASGEVLREESAQQQPEGPGEHGWCCARGEIFEAPRHECLEMGGSIHGDRAEAEQSCRSLRREDALDPRRQRDDNHREAEVTAEAPMKPVSDGQPVPEFLLVDRVLPLDPTDRWVKTGGPIGGLGYDVRYRANDPRSQKIMYVTDNYTGVNISTDGGNNWSAANRGITARTGPSGDAIPVFSLTVDPNNPNIIWAGLKDVSSVYKSVNGGQSWTEVPRKPNRFPKIDAGSPFVFRGFTVRPGNSNVVYAAGEVPRNDIGEAFDRVRGRVYVTTDGGKSWQILWEGDNLARYVIIHPQNHDTLFVSTGIFDREAANSGCKGCTAESMSKETIGCRGGVGVVKSTDGGETWRELGINQGLTDLYIGSLVMHPTNPNVLLAGTGNNSCSDYWLGGKFRSTGGVFLSADGGANWTKTLSNQTITSVEFAPSSPNIAYAAGRSRFDRSTNGGKSWTTTGRGNYPWGPPGALSGFPIDLLVDPDDPNTVFANNYGGGNVKSTDGGQTWTIASQGYTGALMFDVEMHPKNTNTVYASSRSGLFRSDDSGQSWRGLSNPPAMFPESYSVALHPDHPNIVLASQELGGRLYRSGDGGDSWQEVFRLPVKGDVSGMFGFKRIVFAPSANHVVYAASCRSNNHVNKNPTAFGVYVSTNSGKKDSWVRVGQSQLGNKAINDLAVHPKNHNIVWAATASGGLWRTTDGGSNWHRLSGLPPKDVRAVALDPTNPNLVYAGARDGGVHKGVPNANGSWTWHTMAAGMDPNDSVYSLVIDPVRPLRVWAGSQRTGVRYWDPIEQQWIVFNKGLEMRTVFDLDISSNGKMLYAATHGGGVYRLRLSE